MAAESVLEMLVKANVAASAAMVLTLALRPVFYRIFGPRAVYRLWLLVPIIVLAACMPAPEFLKRAVVVVPLAIAGHASNSDGESFVGVVSAAAQSTIGTAETWVATTRSDAWLAYGAPVLLILWIAGAVLLFVRAILTSRNAAANPLSGPALVGTLRPKLILPSDFTTRFDTDERRLIIAHESIHRTSGHPFVNALIETGRCANWFNPLAHIAAFRARADQELSCDAAVIARYPGERRVYAQALLKATAIHAFTPLGCAWPSHSSSLLRARIEMLARPSPGRSRSGSGVVIVAALIAGCGYATWAAQAAAFRASAPPASPGPTVEVLAEPPAGLLTELEKRRHAVFVHMAQAGNINVVFIGDSMVDFWRYESGGTVEWNKSYAPIRAVNFGVQGARTGSVLWRLQNGELGAIEPKLIVLNSLGVADAASHGMAVPQIIQGNKDIVAEIRKRQPSAKILLVSLPRGQPTNMSRSVMTPVNSELAKLADNKAIYYLDLSERFLAPDGRLIGTLYSDDLGQTLNPLGYATWALAMKPQFEELVHR
jgi:beta-lactamase regulating signal transducer with metallopeptidase domain/lysophospholipase L1-like esterase